MLVAKTTEALVLQNLTEQAMTILPAYGPVHVAGSTLRQRPPGMALAVDPDKLGNLFVRKHAGGELGHAHC